MIYLLSWLCIYIMILFFLWFIECLLYLKHSAYTTIGMNRACNWNGREKGRNVKLKKVHLIIEIQAGGQVISCFPLGGLVVFT